MIETKNNLGMQGLQFFVKFWVYLGVNTCEFFLCLGVIICVLYIVSGPFVVLLILCFTSLVSFTGFYTEDEPKLLLTSNLLVTNLKT